MFLLTFINFEREREQGRGRKRVGHTEFDGGSWLWAFSTESNVGLELTNHGVMSWADVGLLKDWATQVPRSYGSYPFSVDILYHIDWFANIEPPLQFGNKSHWIVGNIYTCYIFFLDCTLYCYITSSSVSCYLLFFKCIFSDTSIATPAFVFSSLLTPYVSRLEHSFHVPSKKWLICIYVLPFYYPFSCFF